MQQQNDRPVGRALIDVVHAYRGVVGTGDLDVVRLEVVARHIGEAVVWGTQDLHGPKVQRLILPR